MNIDRLSELVLAAGASEAAFIDAKDIVLSEEFRGICEKNGCGKYGTCYKCPPFVGEIHELMERVRSFPHGLMYRSVAVLEDSFDYEGMVEGSRNHGLLSDRITEGLRLFEGERFLHLSNGGCHLCETCAAKTNEPCRFPEKALPSVESYGMDVYRTAKACGLKYNNGPNTVGYFGIVLFD